ncbi:hypothetical protein LQ424_29650 [Rhodococcus qingshengii]|uniref:hypothetical protein n=1 Tax=Rhodococcus qingshengii TaxID=334542 RepID=UPI001E47636F|nr:hypothetical protein [Rhodococcus qingshengii]MCD2135991.1 hypothetical protein [Rhodococcus qingshengii]
MTNTVLDELWDTLDATGMQLTCVRGVRKHWWSRRTELHDLPDSDIRSLINLVHEADGISRTQED